MKVCYCTKCLQGVIVCTQWDCPGATRDAHGVDHDYDCKFCETRKKALRKKLQHRNNPKREGGEGNGTGQAGVIKIDRR